MVERTTLPWLPQKPDDFASRLSALLAAPDTAGATLRLLAQHDLDANGLSRLAKATRKLRAGGNRLSPLVPLKIGLMGNSTTSLIAPALEATALRYGFDLAVIEAPFGQLVQEAMNPDSVLAGAAPDLILVSIDAHGLPLRECPGQLDSAEASVSGALAQVDAIGRGLRQNTAATLIWQTVPRLPETLFGSFDFRLPGTKRWLFDRFNRALAEQLPSDELLVDVAGLAENIGLDVWHDPVMRNVGKLPFNLAFVPLYADHVMRVIAAFRGKSRKALVLDLDNTLWGGVIGDDGVEGIAIGQGDALGEAHLAVQQAALDLRGRGVILAVSSKNEDETARLPFRQHADMILKEDHFAVFQANWTDKASNLATIANGLSLGRDALVFLDDNPAERMQVRAAHPEIAVPELPADAALYARTLAAAGYFEAVAFSDDDRKRSGFYQDNARRLELQGKSGSLDDYHRSLDMTLGLAPFDAIGRTRIAQLVNKSNQFNLTTRRYAEADIAHFEQSANHFTLQARLRDVFGDNGMIGVIIARTGATDWEIDTWLMSCRVLGRRVEEAMLDEVAAAAAAAGASALIGRYIHTDRNMMVARHYETLGFAPMAGSEGTETLWRLPLAAFRRRDLPMTVTRPDDGKRPR
jgi:FkbH-like protein